MSDQPAESAQFPTHHCAHCGDPVIEGPRGMWAHYRGPGSLLVLCQHTVEYGVEAEPGELLNPPAAGDA